MTLLELSVRRPGPMAEFGILPSAISRGRPRRPTQWSFGDPDRWTSSSHRDWANLWGLNGICSIFGQKEVYVQPLTTALVPLG